MYAQHSCQAAHPRGREAPARCRRTVVLGMGNPILSDDAIGIQLATVLKPQLEGIPGVDVVEECCVGGLNLLDVIEGYDRLVALDSIKTIGGVPGTWYAFDATALRETMNLRNVHDANFATALALGRHMGMYLPDDRRCHVVAVEIADNMTFSESLSPTLEAALPKIVADVKMHILMTLMT
jgi:hydrogenase maturation protease